MVGNGVCGEGGGGQTEQPQNRSPQPLCRYRSPLPGGGMDSSVFDSLNRKFLFSSLPKIFHFERSGLFQAR